MKPRRFRESLHPAEFYYASSYYEIWGSRRSSCYWLRHGFVTDDRNFRPGTPLTAGAAPKRVHKGADDGGFPRCGYPMAACCRRFALFNGR